MGWQWDQVRNQKYLKTNENAHTTTQNLWDTVKAAQRGKFIALQVYLKKIETFKIHNLTLHLQELEGKPQTKPRVSRRKEIIKIRAELKNIENKRTIHRINKSRSWFIQKINKINKSLGRLIKKKREKTQINKVRKERGEIATDNTEIQRIARNY